MPGYFEKMEAGGFEDLILLHDSATGLKGLIAIHSTVLGPALGGTRMWTYPSEEAAVEDVMRLARGMSYKAATAELPVGGGKGLIIGDPNRDKCEALFRSYGCCVEKLRGRFITAVDMGINENDLDCMRRETSFVMGGTEFGSPSPFTAYGVWRGIKACAEEAFGSPSLEGLVVAVQGVGGVGEHLCRYLAGDGARLVVTDLDPAKADQAAGLYGAEKVKPEEIYSRECDIFAPCAGGAVINETTAPQLRCRIVAGPANNVLKDEQSGAILQERGILYAPDYVINAGGLIFVQLNRQGFSDEVEIRRVVARIEGRLKRIFKTVREKQLLPQAVADLLAGEYIRSRSALTGAG